jgi:alpha-ribazole phosphatase/probable phosphoglycerate mutase
MTVIDVIRHGEPVGGRRYRGATDDPLSATGWRPMEEATAGRTWNRIITSPLRRCREFAVELGRRLSVPVSVDVRISEQGFGSWEGRTPDELRRQDPDQLRRFYADPLAYRPEGAEPLDDFLRRIGDSWRDILERHRGEHVLVVGHSGTVRAIVSLVLEVPQRSVFRIAIGYAAMARIEFDGERPPTLAFERA